MPTRPNVLFVFPDQLSALRGRLLRRPRSAVTERAVFIQHKERCIVHGRYKLVADSPCSRALTLYDTQSDPYELDKRVGDAGLRPIVRDLMGRLNRWRAGLTQPRNT